MIPSKFKLGNLLLRKKCVVKSVDIASFKIYREMEIFGVFDLYLNGGLGFEQKKRCECIFALLSPFLYSFIILNLFLHWMPMCGRPTSCLYGWFRCTKVHGKLSCWTLKIETHDSCPNFLFYIYL